MSMRQISERDGYELPAGAGHQRSDDCAHTSRIARLSQLMLLAIGTYFCSSLALWAQQTGDANTSWTATTESQSGDINPTRTIESHTQSANGGLAPAMKVQERRQRGANDTVESQKTTLLPDGAGNWQVSEIRQATTRQEGRGKSEGGSTEERISRRDAEGKLGEVSRSASNESESSPGEKRDTVETYSTNVPGSVSDGSLHLVERARTVQRTSSTGQQSTEQQVEQPSPGDPGSSLRVTILTTGTVRPGPSGAQATRTVQARDVNGDLGVVLVDTTKSDNVHAIQVQIAPSEKPK